MKYILVLIKKSEKNEATVFELEKLMYFVKKFDFSFKLYRDRLIRANYCINESAKLIQHEELEQTKKLLM
mgnify:CR=1 FL=1